MEVGKGNNITISGAATTRVAKSAMALERTVVVFIVIGRMKKISALYVDCEL